MTDEPADLVEKWLTSAKPTYPVAILKNADAIESFLNVKGFPSAGVVDPQGTVRFAGWSGDSEKALGNALAEAKKAPLWPKSLAKVTKLIQENQAAAYAEVKKLLEGGKLAPEDAKVAESFRAHLEGQAASALADGRKSLEDGFVARAHARAKPYASGFPASADCAKLIQELEALPDFKKEMAGGAEFAAVGELLDEDEYTEAFEKYKSIGKKYAGTKIGENALKDAKRLISDGLPGFQPTCEECRNKRRACDRHKEDVKL